MATFHYEVDDEPQSTDQHILTPTQIMENAGTNPAENYLVQIEGKKKISYQDKPNQEIHMHENMKFVTSFTGPVTVSS